MQTSSSSLSANRIFFGRVLGFAAILLMFLAGTGLRWTMKQGQFAIDTKDVPLPYTSLLCMFLSLVTMAGSIWLLRPQVTTLRYGNESAFRHKLRWRWIIIGLVMMAAFAESNGNLIFKDFQISYHLQVALFAGGTFFIAIGLGCAPERRPSISRNSLQTFFTNRTVLALLAILLFGFAIRTWRLGDLIHTAVDEADFMHTIPDYSNWWNQHMMDPMNWTARATHFYGYFQLATTSIWGNDLLGLRMASAIFGTLTIAAMFLLGRALFDNKMGLLAAAMIAIMPAHIHFSRNAMFNIADPFFGTLGLALFLYGLRYNSQRAYILAGASLGFITYLYEGGRFMFLGFAGLCLAFVLLWIRPKKHLRAIALMLIMLGVVMAPFYYNLLHTQESVTKRLDEQAGNINTFRQMLKTMSIPEAGVTYFQKILQFVFWRLIYTPDPGNIYYPVGTGLIQWYIAPLFLLGVAFAFLRLRLAGWFLLAWMLIGCLGISLIGTFEWSPRYCVLFPPMAMLLAIGLRYPLEMIKPPRLLTHPFSMRTVNEVMVVGVVLVGSLGILDYFNQMPEYNLRIRRYFYHYDYVDAFYRANIHAPNSRLIIISGDDVNIGYLDAFRDFMKSRVNYEARKLDETTRAWLESLPKDISLTFAIPPNQTGIIQLLRDTYPTDDLPDTPFDTVPEEQRFWMTVVRR